MILDERNEFADATSVVGATGTALIGDVMDLGPSQARDIGNGEPLYLVIQTVAEITAASAGTISFSLASDAQAAIATDGSATIHAVSGSLVTNVAASNDPRLNAGGRILVVSLPQGATYERFLGILVTRGAVAVATGTVNAFLTRDVSTYRSYADAVPN